MHIHAPGSLQPTNQPTHSPENKKPAFFFTQRRWGREDLETVQPLNTWMWNRNMLRMKGVGANRIFGSVSLYRRPFYSDKHTHFGSHIVTVMETCCTSPSLPLSHLSPPSFSPLVIISNVPPSHLETDTGPLRKICVILAPRGSSSVVLAVIIRLYLSLFLWSFPLHHSLDRRTAPISQTPLCFLPPAAVFIDPRRQSHCALTSRGGELRDEWVFLQDILDPEIYTAGNCCRSRTSTLIAILIDNVRLAGIKPIGSKVQTNPEHLACPPCRVKTIHNSTKHPPPPPSVTHTHARTHTQ